MNELDDCVRSKTPWAKLPANVKHLLGNSQKEYRRYVFDFSIRNQLRFRGNLVRSVRKDERHYYEALVQSSVKRLILFPYHLADMVVKGLRITPFAYYKEIVGHIMEMEKSYDTLPNFTAADCLRLLGIGRNEYIELMNRTKGRGRSWKVNHLSGAGKDLPAFPRTPPLQPWWRLELGYVLDEDVKMLNSGERDLIDLLIDQGSQTLGSLDISTVHSLYKKGLVYVDVPVTGVDRIRVPPLQGFVMNRVTGDYFETLLYKIFVSVDENTSVSDLSAVLQVDIESVKQAVSLYCRLGFAQKLDVPRVPNLHESWENLTPVKAPRPITPLTYDHSSQNSLEMEPVLANVPETPVKEERPIIPGIYKDSSPDDRKGPRFAFLFDSTLTAYLMMGNLSPDLKNHAVTMFEVGKLCDESIDSFLEELDKIGWQDIEGEAKRYWTHALVLRSALRILAPLRPLDLVRCESLQSLDNATVSRLLNNKYKLLATMAPLSREIKAPLGPPHTPPLLGPNPPETNSLWFKLYIYHVTGYGPPTLLLTKGTVLKNLPRIFLGFSRLLISSWQHEAVVLPTCNFLAINATLKYSPVMIQAYGVRDVATTKLLSFPPGADNDNDKPWWNHSGLRRLVNQIDLQHSCGFITLVDIGVPDWGVDILNRDVSLGKPSSVFKRSSASSPVNKTNNFSLKSVTPPQNRTSVIEAKNSEESESSSEPCEPCEPPKKDEKLEPDSLQSPIESHFALTPVSRSKTHSPANGFTSVDCSNILREELDQLEIKQILADEGAADVPQNEPESFDNLLSPLEENISMFSHASENLSQVSQSASLKPDEAFDSKTYKKEKWTLLECHFGVPLFDEEANKKVCNALVKNLSAPESLSKLMESNKVLSQSLLTFISQCQYYPGEDMNMVKRGTLVPTPKKNLVFENGRISSWLGK